jgi:hypothetical protein
MLCVCYSLVKNRIKSSALGIPLNHTEGLMRRLPVRFSIIRPRGGMQSGSSRGALGTTGTGTGVTGMGVTGTGENPLLLTPYP